MQASQVNVFVDVREALSPALSAALIRALGGIPGVGRAAVSPRAPRLVRVDYDPRVTNARHILGVVASGGFEARLVGM